MAHPALTDPTTIDLIEKKVACLIRTRGISAFDADDIRQELYLDLLERLPQHDPEKAPLSLFVAACVHRKVYNLVRHMLSEQRGPIRDSTERMEEEMAETGKQGDTSTADLASLREMHLRDLRVDLASVIKDLNAEEQELFLDLMSETIADIARRTGRTRKMIYRVFNSLRRKLADRGLDQYIQDT